MALQVSTGFKKEILGPRSFAQIFRYGAIFLYSGTQPLTADHAVTGTLLAKVTADGLPWNPGAILNGLLFQQIDEWMRNDPAQRWVLKGVAPGTAGYFRLMENEPGGTAASLTHCRIDGAVGTDPSTAQLRLSSPVIDTSTSLAIDRFYYTLPPVLGE